MVPGQREPVEAEDVVAVHPFRRIQHVQQDRSAGDQGLAGRADDPGQPDEPDVVMTTVREQLLGVGGLQVEPEGQAWLGGDRGDGGLLRPLPHACTRVHTRGRTLGALMRSSSPAAMLGNGTNGNRWPGRCYFLCCKGRLKILYQLYRVICQFL